MRTAGIVGGLIVLIVGSFLLTVASGQPGLLLAWLCLISPLAWGAIGAVVWSALSHGRTAPTVTRSYSPSRAK